MKRWYVTMTWDDWPDGGSYGTIIETADHADELEAHAACRQEMAEVRADEENQATYFLEHYAEDWCVVDCWDLDEFIKRHSPLAKVAPQLLEALKSAEDHILCILENHQQKCPPGPVRAPAYITAAIEAATN